MLGDHFYQSNNDILSLFSLLFIQQGPYPNMLNVLFILCGAKLKGIKLSHYTWHVYKYCINV